MGKRIQRVRDWFEERRPTKRGVALAAVAVAGIGVVAFTGGNAGLPTTPDYPQPGIVALELATSTETAEELEVNPEEARSALLWDVPVILGYGLALGALGLLATAGFRLRRLRELGRTILLAAVSAAMLLDVLENVCLWFAVGDLADSGGLLRWAACFAWGKFVLLAVAGILVVSGLVSRLTTPRWLRDLLGRTHEPVTVTREGDPRALGLAISGGGVRSASVALGALQVLEEEDERLGDRLGWQQAHRVTAISGGAYMSGAWSLARTQRRETQPGEAQPERARPEESWTKDSPEERHLLDNLGYLLATQPRGAVREPREDADPERANQRSGTDHDGLGSRAFKGDAEGGIFRPSAIAVVLSSLVVNLLVMGAALLAVTVPYGWLLRWVVSLHGGAPDTIEEMTETSANVADVAFVQPEMLWPGLLWLAIGVALSMGWVALTKLAPGVMKSPVAAGGRYVGTAALALGGVLLVLLAGLPWLVSLVSRLTGSLEVASVLGLVGSLAGVVRLLRKPAARFAPMIAGVAFFLLAVGTLALVTRWCYDRAAGWDVVGALGDGPSRSAVIDAAQTTAGVWLLAVLFLVLVWVIGSPEWWSLAPFYRGKLRLAYATYRDSDGTVRAYANSDASGEHEPLLTAYPNSPLEICASSTVSTREVRTHYGIPALSVSFTPEHVEVRVPQDGVGTSGRFRCPTGRMEQAYASRGRDKRSPINTMFAVAVSGAAVSPAMGRFRIGPTSMLLAFLNVRLGVWLPNPRYVACEDYATKYRGRRFPTVRLGYLFKEFLGIHDPSDAFVYVTDGGHWENTGLVELLRCSDYREVVCIDADQGPEDAVRSISQAIDLAKLECNVDVLVDLEDLRATPSGHRGPAFARRSVTLGLLSRCGKGEDGRFREHTGILWYAKPALTRDLPSMLLAHREVNPSFPRASTLDQFFDTATFFAYRGLGRHNARCIRRARVALIEDLCEWESWEDFRRSFETGGEDRPWAAQMLLHLIDLHPDAARQAVMYDDVRRTLVMGSSGQTAEDEALEEADALGSAAERTAESAAGPAAESAGDRPLTPPDAEQAESVPPAV